MLFLAMSKPENNTRRLSCPLVLYCQLFQYCWAFFIADFSDNPKRFIKDLATTAGSLTYFCSSFTSATIPDIVSLNFPNSFLAKQSSHDIMHLLLACVQKRNEHSTFQANPDGFAGSYICSPMQSNFSFAQKKKAPCQRQGANLREAKQLTE